MVEEIFSSGLRAVCFHFQCTKYIYVIATLYWVPNYTTNTLFPVDMKIFYGFNSTSVEILEYYYFIDHYIKELSCATTIKNNLDYLKLKVIKPT